MQRLLPSVCALALLFSFLSSAFGDDKEERVKPTNLEKLNSDQNEDDPHLASNGSALYYTFTSKGKSEIRVSAKRPTVKVWPAGKAIPDLKGKADFRSVFIMPEGRFPQMLFFATNKNPRDGSKGDNYDLYFITKQFEDAEFTSERAMIICTARDEMYPWMTKDGLSMYYSRKDKDGWHLYVTSKPGGGGQFAEPQDVGLPVGFHHATLTPDGKTMYLQGPLEKDRVGLFRSTLTGKKWSKPEPLTALNDPEAQTGDRSPNLSRDGNWLYFVSDRVGGKGGLDIWVIATKELATKK